MVGKRRMKETALLYLRSITHPFLPRSAQRFKTIPFTETARKISHPRGRSSEHIFLQKKGRHESLCVCTLLVADYCPERVCCLARCTAFSCPSSSFLSLSLLLDHQRNGQHASVSYFHAASRTVVANVELRSRLPA